MTNHQLAAISIRWGARLVAVVMFALAGAFFLEHLQEWFIEPLPETPPVRVWVSQLLHLGYLVGLAVGCKWPRLGGVLSIAFAVIFLIDKNPPLILPTIIPGILYLISWYVDRSQRMQLTA